MKLAKIWILIVCSAAILSPFFFSQSSLVMNFEHVLEGPSLSHLFGTDSLGRDLLLRTLCGATASLGVGLCATVVAILLGVIIGATSAYCQGWVDEALMRFADIMLSVPTLFLILATVAWVGPSVFNTAVIIGLTSWMSLARLVRADILSVRQKPYVLAAQSFGAKGGWIIRKHLIPSAFPVILVYTILNLSSALFLESALSFLGLGVQPPAASWGNILTEAKSVLNVAWWLVLFPGAFIFFTIFSLNSIGQSLERGITKKQ